MAKKVNELHVSVDVKIGGKPFMIPRMAVAPRDCSVDEIGERIKLALDTYVAEVWDVTDIKSKCEKLEAKIESLQEKASESAEALKQVRASVDVSVPPPPAMGDDKPKRRGRKPKAD